MKNLLLTNQRLIEIERDLINRVATFNKNIISIDIETRAKPTEINNEDAALSHLTGDISCIGVYYPGFAVVLRDQEMVTLPGLLSGNSEITGHNFKFDAKFLIHNNILTPQRIDTSWMQDSSLLSAISTEKIPDAWLVHYEEKRKQANKLLPRGHSHRQAGGGSLKTLAPYFLDVQPFWETPQDHNNDEYVILDAMYTYYLTQLLLNQVINNDGAERCYKDLLERSKMVMTAELAGVNLDIVETQKRLQENKLTINKLEGQINTQWSKYYDLWRVEQEIILRNKYDQMCTTAITKNSTAKKPKAIELIQDKYNKLFNTAKESIEPLNINSPTQLIWLLRDNLGYDVHDLSGDEGTGKEVLQILSEQHSDIKVLQDYRFFKKLGTTYYPELLNAAKYDNKIHCSFNLTGTKTGRLSSSNLNLQNQPKHIKDLFIAAPGNVLIDLDMSMLEPILIAFYSEDKELINLIENGYSFHSFNAKVMFDLPCDIASVASEFPKERKAAKTAGLSILYGSGANRLHKALTSMGFTQFDLLACKKIVYKIRDTYSSVWQFKTELDKVLEEGNTIYNYLGRPIKYLNKEDIYMKGFNGLIQGSGSDIVMQASVDLYKKYKWIYPRLWVHDSICIEVIENRAEEAKSLLDYEMTKWDIKTSNSTKLKFATEGGYGKNWKI